MTINYEECAKAGLEPETVSRLGRRLERLAGECRALGIQIFSGSGTASLRFDDNAGLPPLILGDFVAPNVDGGAGVCMLADDGYERSE